MRPLPAVELRELLDPLTIVQMLIETPLGVANAEAIAALDGVDSLCIGANDLTAELGIPGDYSHPAFCQAVATVAAACRRHDVPLQVGGVGDAQLRSLLPLGVCRLMLTGTDTDLLYTAAQGRVRELDRWNRREPQEVGTL
jgi:2-keto-3-deoxy-L-rhamnonate aldolase RhmA